MAHFKIDGEIVQSEDLPEFSLKARMGKRCLPLMMNHMSWMRLWLKW